MTKLSKQKKIELYQEWKIKGMPLLVIARRENLNRTALGYAIKLIDRYGPAILDAPHQTYTKEFKEKAIKQALFGTKSIVQLSLDLGLKSSGMLNNWLREYKENGYNVVIKQKGRPAYEQEGRIIAPAAAAEDSAVRRRKLAIAYRQCLYKKINCLGAETTQEIVQAITELRRTFKVSLDYIFDTMSNYKDLPLIARSTYYYTTSQSAKQDKQPKLTARIKEIFVYHQKRYGYRRIALQLIKEGWQTSVKVVRRIMSKLGLKANKRNRRKYSSYCGTVGKIAPNLIKRNFFALRPNMKWYTDITEFHLKGQKLYLSPILDGCAGDIVSYSISRHPNMELVLSMLDKAFVNHQALNACEFHTDQGVQYQSPVYQRALKLHGITQSMSRKGNSMDDGLMESFFGLLKTEMFYGQEYKYHNLQELTKAIEEYIRYYNEERIKERLKGLTPKEYRAQALKK